MPTAGIRRVGWYADRADTAMASIRLRMLQPMRTLVTMGHGVEEYDPARGPAAYHTVVFSKSLDEAGLRVARQVLQGGGRVVYDLCDSLHDSREGSRRNRRVAVLEQFLQLAHVVVFSTPGLRRQMVERYPALMERSVVIPDQLELLGSGEAGIHWAARWRITRLRRFLAAHSRSLHCVWFGKSQGRLSGVHHLGAAVRHLEQLGQETPVTLTVISNSWARYRSASRDWRVPHHYLPWSLESFGPALRTHDVAVIPVEVNGYTQGKSINRPATAILAGLGVVGDCIESYEELRPFLEFDDWHAGLRRYASLLPARDPRLSAARELLLSAYGPERIATLWREVLMNAEHTQAVA